MTNWFVSKYILYYLFQNIFYIINRLAVLVQKYNNYVIELFYLGKLSRITSTKMSVHTWSNTLYVWHKNIYLLYLIALGSTSTCHILIRCIWICFLSLIAQTTFMEMTHYTFTIYYLSCLVRKQLINATINHWCCHRENCP